MDDEIAPADYRDLVDSLKYCVIVHDAETKAILWANQAACDFLGFTLDELKPLTASDMSGRAPQYSREMGLAWLQRAVEHGVSAIEWCTRTRTGEEILTEAIAIRVALRSRTVVLSQFRDIAQEKEIQRDLFRTEGRLRAFLQNLAEGIVVLDEAAVVEFASESAARLLHVDVEHLGGADFRDFCDPPTRRLLDQQLASTSRGAPVQRSRYRLVTPDGTARWYSASCQYLDLESDLHGHLLLFHDITERVEAEELHRQDVAHLDYLARYNAMGDMAMAIAHEVAQPLSAAANFLEGARGRLTGAGHEKVVWGLDSAKAQLDRATQILTSLRQFVVRLEQSMQCADLNDIVGECRYLLDVRARGHSVDLQVFPSAEPLPVRCERVLIGQVVLNLGFNAIDEMARWPLGQRSVEIRTRVTGTSAEVSVLDRGQGITAFPDGRIFDGVFTSKPHGSGIGLALSQRIISRHHGRISARENSPHGAIFAFELPLSPADDASGK
ncbi:PAS domain S-box protein [Amycolatopsis jejuensis]|uniref:PAS domain S-box protein n=1 Tax=Amycolatopsis jejuensis TaxID=330084 RepID=UPI000527F05F|nr:PAS domain S-box protein [Amycolatopsis jejuensis]